MYTLVSIDVGTCVHLLTGDNKPKCTGMTAISEAKIDPTRSILAIPLKAIEFNILIAMLPSSA